MKEGGGCHLGFSLERDLIASGTLLTLNIKPVSPHLLGEYICAPRQLISLRAAPFGCCWLCWVLRDAGSHPMSYSVSSFLSYCYIKTLLIS